MTFKTLLAFAVGMAAMRCATFGQQKSSITSPREQLQQYVMQLQANPADDGLRTKIIQLALTLDPRPATSKNAEAADGEGKTIFAHASTPDDLKAAAAAFAQASQLAPWVPDYYFNEASALEKLGQFDDTIHALNFYLLAAPNASDAGEVQGRIEGIKREKKKSATSAAQAALDEADKYVAGGARRVPCEVLFNGSVSDGVKELYIYGDNQCELIGRGYLSNVFQMPNGHLLAVVLQAKSRNDGFSGDQIFLAEVSASPSGDSYAFGTLNGALRLPDATRYKVSVSALGADGVVVISEESSSASITVPLRDLYVARTQYFDGGTHGGNVFEGQNYLWRYQGGDPQSILFFDANVNSGDPFNRTPRYVVLNNGRDRQVANSGYHIRWDASGRWTIER